MTSSLTVRNITQKDFGPYTCKASNSEGEVRLSFLKYQSFFSSQESLTLHLLPDLTSGASQVPSVSLISLIYLVHLLGVGPVLPGLLTWLKHA